MPYSAADDKKRIVQTARIPLDQTITAIAVSQDGSRLAVGTRQSCQVQVAETGELLHRWATQTPVTDLQFGRSGLLVAALGAPPVNVYSLEQGKLVREIRRDDAIGSLRTAPQVHACLIDRDRSVVSSGTGNRTVISNRSTGKWEHIMFVKYEGCAVTASFDGEYVSVFGKQNPRELSGHVSLFKTHRGLRPVWTNWHTSRQAVTHVAFDSHAKRLVSCGAGDGARVWSLESGSEIWHFASQSRPYIAASFVGLNDLVALLTPNTIQVRSLSNPDGIQAEKRNDGEEWKTSSTSESGQVIAVENGESIAIFRLTEDN